VPPPEVDDRSLVDVLTASPAGDDCFVAVAPDWFGPQAFGGVVVAHAVNAAVQTVDDPSQLHSLHGYFLRPVASEEPVQLNVQRTRDGRSFRTRQVTTEQGGKPVFTMVCSFHTPEDGEEYQPPMPADVPPPEDLVSEQLREDGLPAPFDVREAPIPPAGPDGTYSSTRRGWFRVADPLPEDPAVHLTLAAFVSDMTGTSFRPHNLGEWGTHTDASLDHAVWFHHPQRMDEWLLYDLHAVINHGARSVVRGAMYSSDGQLRFSIVQELLIRPLPAQNS
jgi:acyl-CoA thioesterase II